VCTGVVREAHLEAWQRAGHVPGRGLDKAREEAWQGAAVNAWRKRRKGRTRRRRRRRRSTGKAYFKTRTHHDKVVGIKGRRKNCGCIRKS